MEKKINADPSIHAVVPVHYGMIRVSGQILNAYVKNLQRGEQDNIRVDDTMN